MTLREALGADVTSLHKTLDRLLDEDDAFVVFFDGDRTISYVAGQSMSPCQQELATIEIERVMRGIAEGTANQQNDASLDDCAATEARPS